MFYEPYPMGLGGNFVTQRLILERLSRWRIKPLVVAPMEGPALERFRALGVECVVIPPPGALDHYGGQLLRTGMLARLKSAVDLLRYNIRIARFLRERCVSVIYANCVRAQMCVGLGARLVGVPSLLYVKSELANPIIDCFCFFLSSKILFFTPQIRDDRYPFLVSWFGRKIHVVPAGLDPSVIASVEQRDLSALRRELDISAENINVAILAQLYRPKGQHFALEALSHLVADFPNLRLYLVGDHVLEEYRPYREELEALIERRGLGRHIRFTGWRQDALEIVSQMDIVLHPSLAEGMPFSVLEAMAFGKPVIASAVGGLREVIINGCNGYLTAPGDVQTIIRRWRELASDVALRRRMGQEARRTLHARYLIDDQVGRLAKIWTEMALGLC